MNSCQENSLLIIENYEELSQVAIYIVYQFFKLILEFSNNIMQTINNKSDSNLQNPEELMHGKNGSEIISLKM